MSKPTRLGDFVAPRLRKSPRRKRVSRKDLTTPIDIAVLGTEPLYPDFDYDERPESLEETHLISARPHGPVIAIGHQALMMAVSHTAQQSEVESGGACLGYVCRDRHGERLLICLEGIVPAEYMAHETVLQGKAHLTFTPEAWEDMIQVQLQDYPDMRLLGWYHSHPNLGIFLSSWDKFIHNNFFTMPWHVALVIDPKQKRFATFARYGQELLPSEILAWTDDPSAARALTL